MGSLVWCRYGSIKFVCSLVRAVRLEPNPPPHTLATGLGLNTAGLDVSGVLTLTSTMVLFVPLVDSAQSEPVVGAGGLLPVLASLACSACVQPLYFSILRPAPPSTPFPSLFPTPYPFPVPTHFPFILQYCKQCINSYGDYSIYRN